MKGITSSGFEYEINEGIIKDWRFTKAIALADSEDETDKLSGYTKVVQLLLGKEGEKKLEKHVMTEDGMVPMESINREVIEMMHALRQNPESKN